MVKMRNIGNQILISRYCVFCSVYLDFYFAQQLIRRIAPIYILDSIVFARDAVTAFVESMVRGYTIYDEASRAEEHPVE